MENVRASASLKLSGQQLFQFKGNKKWLGKRQTEHRNTNPIKKTITTKTLQPLIDGALKSYMHCFGERQAWFYNG